MCFRGELIRRCLSKCKAGTIFFLLLLFCCAGSADAANEVAEPAPAEPAPAEPAPAELTTDNESQERLKELLSSIISQPLADFRNETQSRFDALDSTLNSKLGDIKDRVDRHDQRLLDLERRVAGMSGSRRASSSVAAGGHLPAVDDSAASLADDPLNLLVEHAPLIHITPIQSTTTAASTPVSVSNAKKVYFIVIADTSDNRRDGNGNNIGIGRGAKVNMDAMIRLVKNLVEKSGERLPDGSVSYGDCKYIGPSVGDFNTDKGVAMGSNCNVKGITELLNKLPKDPAQYEDATIFCYVAAHGGVRKDGGRLDDKNRIFQFTNVAGGKENVSRRALFKILADRGARQTVLISDSCSNAVSEGTVFTPLSLTASQIDAADPNRFALLLLRGQGHISINGSKLGQFAWYTSENSVPVGGLFTRAVLEVSRKNSTMNSWKDWLLNCRTKTAENFNDHLRNTPLNDPIRKETSVQKPVEAL